MIGAIFALFGAAIAGFLFGIVLKLLADRRQPW